MINKKDIKIVLSDIDKVLNRSGFRFTKQRLIIANEIFSKNPKHFTVQCIFKELIRKNKKVALASVYNTINKFVELEIIKEELKNSGKKDDMIEKIAAGKMRKFISDNTLLNQMWIMDTKLKVNQVIKQYSKKDQIKVLDFVRFKVGEGID